MILGSRIVAQTFTSGRVMGSLASNLSRNKAELMVAGADFEERIEFRANPPTQTSALIVIPAFNEERFLEVAVKRIYEVMQPCGFDFRVAIAEDGSTDMTREIANRLESEFPQLIIQHALTKRGRGWAIRTLCKQVDASVYAFSDADLASGVTPLRLAAEAILSGEEVVVGSRYAPGSAVNRPPLRGAVSGMYNALVNLWFEDSIRDHQCGLKAFSRNVRDAVFPLAREDSWFWDTQVLILAKAAGFNVREIPVSWSERKYWRTSIRRLAHDVYLHGTGLLRLKGQLEVLKRQPSARFIGAPTGSASLLTRNH